MNEQNSQQRVEHPTTRGTPQYHPDVDGKMRGEIRELLQAVGYAEVDRMRRLGVDSVTVKRLMDRFQGLRAAFPTYHHGGETPHAALRDSFIWRLVLGCEPSMGVRDHAIEQLHELQTVDPEISLEPISPSEVDQMVSALCLFLGGSGIADSPEGERNRPRLLVYGLVAAATHNQELKFEDLADHVADALANEGSIRLGSYDGGFKETFTFWPTKLEVDVSVEIKSMTVFTGGLGNSGANPRHAASLIITQEGGTTEAVISIASNA